MNKEQLKEIIEECIFEEEYNKMLNEMRRTFL
jgi:hypothetical protein